MANIQAAKKAIRVNQRKRTFNDRRRKTMREAIKQIEMYVEAGKIADAKAILPEAYKAIDKAKKGGVIKENTAARKKSRLARITKEA